MHIGCRTPGQLLSLFFKENGKVMNPLQEYLSSTPVEKVNTSMVAYVANLTKVAEVAPDIASDVVKEFDTQRKHLKLIASNFYYVLLSFMFWKLFNAFYL